MEKKYQQQAADVDKNKTQRWIRQTDGAECDSSISVHWLLITFTATHGLAFPASGWTGQLRLQSTVYLSIRLLICNPVFPIHLFPSHAYARRKKETPKNAGRYAPRVSLQRLW